MTSYRKTPLVTSLRVIDNERALKYTKNILFIRKWSRRHCGGGTKGWVCIGIIGYQGIRCIWTLGQKHGYGNGWCLINVPLVGSRPSSEWCVLIGSFNFSWYTYFLATGSPVPALAVQQTLMDQWDRQIRNPLTVHHWMPRYLGHSENWIPWNARAGSSCDGCWDVQLIFGTCDQVWPDRQKY